MVILVTEKDYWESICNDGFSEMDGVAIGGGFGDDFEVVNSLAESTVPFSDPIALEVDCPAPDEDPSNIYVLFETEDCGTVCVNYNALDDYMSDRLFKPKETQASHWQDLQDLKKAVATQDEGDIEDLCQEAEDGYIGFFGGLYTFKQKDDVSTAAIPGWDSFKNRATANGNMSVIKEGDLIDKLHEAGYSMTGQGIFQKVNSQCDAHGINWVYEEPKQEAVEKHETKVDTDDLLNLFKGLT